MTRALLAALLVAAALPCSAEIVMPRSGAMGTINGQTIACQTPETFGTVSGLRKSSWPSSIGNTL